MSAPTYTVEEDRPGVFSACRGDAQRFSTADRKVADSVALNLNVHEQAFAMLALLVESRGLLGSPSKRVAWQEKRDALLEQITGTRTPIDPAREAQDCARERSV